MQFSSALVMAFAAAANAATIKVDVSNLQANTSYFGNDITASVGDSVEFTFFPKNHTVTQSSFADPCHPLAGGFFSTFIPVNASIPSTLGTTFTIQVNDTKPIWFYCSQTTGTHCQKGMVGAINAPATGNTLAKFTALAANASTSTFPLDGKTVIGGILKKGSSSTGSNSTSSVAPPSSSTSAYTSTYTTEVVYQTTVTSLCTSQYTSAGTTYYSGSTYTYATSYSSAVATTATGVATVGAGSGSGSGSSTATSSGLAQVTGAAAGFSANMVGVGAVVLGALAMV